MSVERDRLLSLIEFSQQAARLRGKPVANVTAHNLFSIYEHEIQRLPGIQVNINGVASEDEIWLSVERLHELQPPAITSAVLRPWVQMSQGPTVEPTLRATTDGANLIAAGTHAFEHQPERGKPFIAVESTVALADYELSALVKDQRNWGRTTIVFAGREKSGGASPIAPVLGR